MLNFTKPKTMVLGSFLLITLTVLCQYFDLIDTETHSEAGKYDAYSVMLLFTALIISSIGYVLLWINKKEINKYLSLSNFLFLLGSIFMFIAGMCTFSMILAFLSIQIYLMNMFFGLRGKTKPKKKNLE